jgi:hypothetical protein
MFECTYHDGVTTVVYTIIVLPADSFGCAAVDMCWVCEQRKGAQRAEEILTANKKAVSNEGTVKIPARKTKDTTLVRHRPVLQSHS